MTDSQNKSAWNDWANYLLHIVKKHDGDLESIRLELKAIGVQEEKIENLITVISHNKKDLDKLDKEIIKLGLQVQELQLIKLNENTFDDFYANDYKVFKTELLTEAKIKGIIWGTLSGVVVTTIGILLRILLNF